MIQENTDLQSSRGLDKLRKCAKIILEILNF